jgi:hypothetical protein
LDATTTGTVTATISSSSVDTLKTLTGTNAYTITIASGDATGSTAAEFNTINGATTVAIDASAVTGLASDTAANIKTLLTAGNDTAQFAGASFGSLATAVVSDTTLSGSDLAGAIDQANTATGGTGTVFTITDASEITGTEANFTDLITDEGNSQIDISNQNLTIDSGTLSVANARTLSDTTSGTVTGTIASGTTIAAMLDSSSGLIETDAYTITIAAGDEEVTATNLTALYGKTSVAVDASAVTQITGTVAEANIVYGAGPSEITGLGNEI